MDNCTHFRNVVAVEADGLNIRVMSIAFEVPGLEFDLMAAVRKAASDFCETDKGKEIYEYNCGNFNWADFDMSVPNEFCEKYGFRKADNCLFDIVVDWDEQLADITGEIEEEFE